MISKPIDNMDFIKNEKIVQKKNINKEIGSFYFKVYRQRNSKSNGRFVMYLLDNISKDLSLLEAIDKLNEKLIISGEDPIAFESDCREGICGSCSLIINGIPHGKQHGTTACQLHMRSFIDGSTIVLEPFRTSVFPIIKDLVTDRSGLDKIQQNGGYISANIGSSPLANTILIPKSSADKSFEAAACIGCGACVAACKNSSAMLFISAKVSHLSNLPQGQMESGKRIKSMLDKAEELGFGICSNTLDCEAVCPKNISSDLITEMNWEYISSQLRSIGHV